MNNATEALAVWKSIRRNHSFFAEGGMFGHDWQTFRSLYPRDARVLASAILMCGVS